MRCHTFLIVLLLYCGPGELTANVEPLTEQESQQVLDLSRLCWVENLPDQQSAQIVQALDSEKSAVVLEALRAVAIHRLRNAYPQVSRLATERGVAADRAFAEIVGRGLETGADMSAVLRNSLSDSLAGDEWRDVDGEMKPYYYVRGMVSATLVVDEARSVRQGLKDDPDVEGLELSDYERMLLDYAKRPDAESIREIIAILRDASMLSSREYDLVGVLGTYDVEAIDAVLNELSDSARVATMSGYGKTALLGYVQQEIGRLEETQIDRLKRSVQIMKNSEFDPLNRTIEGVEQRIGEGR